jgi:hypothetical protein
MGLADYDRAPQRGACLVADSVHFEIGQRYYLATCPDVHGAPLSTLVLTMLQCSIGALLCSVKGLWHLATTC